MLVPNRHSSSDSYRYGFQGQEKDDEIKGEGNSLNYTFRMHDPRVGRFFATDPLYKEYPFYTPYSFSGNKPIQFIEREGLEEEAVAVFCGPPGWVYTAGKWIVIGVATYLAVKKADEIIDNNRESAFGSDPIQNTKSSKSKPKLPVTNKKEIPKAKTNLSKSKKINTSKKSEGKRRVDNNDIPAPKEQNPSVPEESKVQSETEKLADIENNSTDCELPSLEEKVEIEIDATKYPEAAKHIEEAQENGHPSELTVDRDGAKKNRRESLKGKKGEPGMDRDEYPPAVFKEGGNGASVKNIPSSDNRGAGASMGRQLKGVPNGSKVIIKVKK